MLKLFQIFFMGHSDFCVDGWFDRLDGQTATARTGTETDATILRRFHTCLIEWSAG